jgi:hypothetical protein
MVTITFGLVKDFFKATTIGHETSHAMDDQDQQDPDPDINTSTSASTSTNPQNNASKALVMVTITFGLVKDFFNLF